MGDHPDNLRMAANAPVIKTVDLFNGMESGANFYCAQSHMVELPLEAKKVIYRSTLLYKYTHGT